MEKLSRVKKYAELRKSIETENAISDVSRDAMSSEQQEALKKFDSSILKRANIENETHRSVKKTNRCSKGKLAMSRILLPMNI